MELVPCSHLITSKYKILLTLIISQTIYLRRILVSMLFVTHIQDMYLQNTFTSNNDHDMRNTSMYNF